MYARITADGLDVPLKHEGDIISIDSVHRNAFIVELKACSGADAFINTGFPGPVWQLLSVGSWL